MLDSFDQLVLGAALLVFAVGLLRRARMWRVGVELARDDALGARLRRTFVDAVAHARILRDRTPGLMHLMIFLGFLAPICAVVLAQAGLVLPGFLGWIASLLLDLIALAAVAAVGYAFYRRYGLRPERLDNKREDFLVLLLIAAILLTGFSVAALRIARTGEGFLPSPVAWTAARPLTLLGAEAQQALIPWVWRTHFLLVMFCLASVPYWRLLHIVTSPLNVLFRDTGPRGRASLIDLEDEDAENFGVSDVHHFTWKDLLDLDACTRCGRCQDGCPAHLTKKPLSPKKAVQEIKQRWLEKAGELVRKKARGETIEDEEESVLIDERLTRDTIWACTTCRYCEEHCPVCIEPVSKLLDTRRYLVLMESAFPAEMKDTFKNLENNGNPWGVGHAYRADWAEGKDVPVLEEGSDEVEVLYWVGCAGSFDDRHKTISDCMARIFKAAGVSFGILGVEETCCGDPARRAGNEYLYQMQAQQNVETLNGRKFKRIVTQCPHCLHVLGAEYPQLGGTYDVVSHVPFVLELLKTGRLTLGAGEPLGETAYHDSCYLGRYRGIYDEPRELLALLDGGSPPREAERHRERSFCCGAGGGRMWLEETLGDRRNPARVDQPAPPGGGRGGDGFGSFREKRIGGDSRLGSPRPFTAPPTLLRKGRLVIPGLVKAEEALVGEGGHDHGEGQGEEDAHVADHEADAHQHGLDDVQEGQRPEVGEIELPARFHGGPEVHLAVENEEVGHLVHHQDDEAGEDAEDEAEGGEDGDEKACHHGGDEHGKALEQVAHLETRGVHRPLGRVVQAGHEGAHHDDADARGRDESVDEHEQKAQQEERPQLRRDDAPRDPDVGADPDLAPGRAPHRDVGGDLLVVLLAVFHRLSPIESRGDPWAAPGLDVGISLRSDSRRVAKQD
ncbi:MAG: (Fe-S)-binding protein [Planctomycetota bacterium]|jgi:Fe-S oxidoreductase/nitrate reductase gamma subunit